MNAKTQAIGKMLGNVAAGLKGGVSKIGGYLKENERLNKAAASAMDKKYPGGWSQSAGNISELQSIKKKIKK